MPGATSHKQGTTPVFALVDCNNFYASCERVFNPALKKRPVVVLSNNDGCVIARSSEAKKLGIKMGVPAFHINKLLEDNQVAVFSSNYALYGDFSLRVMHTLSNFTPSLEVYSIDEAFLDLTGLSTNSQEAYARKIRETVVGHTGIPVSIGVAPTKTLAKIANHLAKNRDSAVCILDTEDKREEALRATPVGEVWGIGKQQEKLLGQYGIATAWDLTQLPDNWVRKNLTVKGLRTKQELEGISCLQMEEIPPAKKAICTSRSFGQSQTNLEAMEEAVATFATRCAEKLRRQHSVASQLMVFIHTNGFRDDLPQYARNRVINLSPASNNSLELVKHSTEALRCIFRQGFAYKKAGVIVTGLIREDEVQNDLFKAGNDEKQKRLMESVDALNRKIGQDAIKIATQGSGRKWKLRQEKLSPCYTTRWNELIEIHL